MEKKDLNTYVYNICFKNTFEINYKGLTIIVSNSARDELLKYRMTLDDCKEILRKGSRAPRKRRRNTIEKWLSRGNKTYNLVIVKNYNNSRKEYVWVLIHVGKFTRRKIL